MPRFLTALLALCLLSTSGFAAEKKDSAFDRVMKSGTIRCGYATWPPTLVKDPNTGKMSGYSYDVMNAVGEKLGLKVEWAEETGWGTAEEGLTAGRYDMMCGDVCHDARRTRQVWYSTPFIHIPVYAFGRADDTRFDKDQSALDNPAYKVAIIPNTVFDYAAKLAFPRAQALDVNDLGGNIDMLMAVTTGKADASFNNYYSIEQFNKTNGNSIKIIGDPVRYCHGGFLLPRGDMEFKTMIDAALLDLNSSGELHDIFLNYAPDTGKYWSAPAKPYGEEKP